MNLLKISDISKNYHSINGETQALLNITFNVDYGDFICILGPSGCGKSTLLNILSGLLKPSAGEILYENSSIEENYDKIGYMFQKDNLFEWYTVYQNVILGLKIKKQLNEESKKRADLLLKQYGLYKFKDYYPKELSGGMRQRVALIRTLALNPEVLFLDEPFSALDYQSRLLVCDDVYKIIKNEKKTAIMVTHDIAEAISLAQKVVVLGRRPSRIKKIIDIDFKNKELTPFQKREESEFKKYFDVLWKELDK